MTLQSTTKNVQIDKTKLTQDLNVKIDPILREQSRIAHDKVLRRLIMKFFNFRSTIHRNCECCIPKIKVKRKQLNDRWIKYCKLVLNQKKLIPTNPNVFNHYVDEILAKDGYPKNSN